MQVGFSCVSLLPQSTLFLGGLFRIPGELFSDERLSGILPPISGISLCNEMLLLDCKWPSRYKVIVMVSLNLVLDPS